MLQVSRMKTEVPLPAPPQSHPAAFVLGADEDVIVDVQAVEETAALYHVQPHILRNSAHDVMLVRWCSLYPLYSIPQRFTCSKCRGRASVHIVTFLREQCCAVCAVQDTRWREAADALKSWLDTL